MTCLHWVLLRVPEVFVSAVQFVFLGQGVISFSNFKELAVLLGEILCWGFFAAWCFGLFWAHNMMQSLFEGTSLRVKYQPTKHQSTIA